MIGDAIERLDRDITLAWSNAKTSGTVAQQELAKPLVDKANGIMQSVRWFHSQFLVTSNPQYLDDVRAEFPKLRLLIQAAKRIEPHCSDAVYYRNQIRESMRFLKAELLLQYVPLNAPCPGQKELPLA